MKNKILILLFAIASTAIYALDSYIESFTAYSDGKSIYLEWRPVSETDIRRYDVERQVNKQDFKSIYKEDAAGKSSYKFTDTDVLYRNSDNPETTQSKTSYNYRIKIIKKNNTYSYSNNVPVAHNISSVRRTWGMIKELFR